MSAGKGLTEAMVLAAAEPHIFERGEEYVDDVFGLNASKALASAIVRGSADYQVTLDWSGRSLDGTCTCPHHAEGWFCKHLVAVALVLIMDGIDPGEAPRSGAGDDVEDSIDDVLTRQLNQLEHAELVDLVAELAELDHANTVLIQRRLASTEVTMADLEIILDNSVKAATSTLGFVDYQDAFEVANDIDTVLEQIEEVLDDGHPDATLAPLLRAVKRCRAIMTKADDSGGMLGVAAQQAVDLYARACREGAPEAKKVARWLVKFREESPGWPNVTLKQFAQTFDDAAMDVYRKAVHAASERHAGDRHRHEIDEMLLEIYDYDGDVDAAVRLLRNDPQPQYGAIVQRLRTAGRQEETVAAIDEAVAAGRVSGKTTSVLNSYWLNPDYVTETYLGLGRENDALQVRREAFLSRMDADQFERLLDVGDRLGRRDELREWALNQVEQRTGDSRYPNGAAAIDIALSEDDLERAWLAAKRWGAGHEWQRLAEALSKEWPERAAELHLAQAMPQLQAPNAKLYPDIASLLKTAGKLQALAGQEQAFSDLMASIRQTYGNRPALMRALNKAKLP